MLDIAIPDLTLEGLALAPKQSPIDLRWLLYPGVAATHGSNIKGAVESGRLGEPLLERLPFLTAIHAHWQANVIAKKFSTATIAGQWTLLRAFVSFVESIRMPLTVAGALDLYLAYCVHIKRRGDLKPASQYAYSLGLAGAIAPAIGHDSTKLQWKSKIRAPKQLDNKAAKENLQVTTNFIQTLLETVEQVPVDVVRGPLPVTLRFPAGSEHTIHLGLPLQPLESLKLGDAHKRKRAVCARERGAKDISNRARAQLINLRLEAELLIFINQTGCNLTQALRLTGSQFRYQSEGDYLRLSVWKHRARHAVELRIHKGYRKHLEVFLEWRSRIFPGDPDGLTFPFVRNDGDLAIQRTKWDFSQVRNLMKAIGQPFISAAQLRKTIGNFARRRLSREFAAELLGNTEKTFRKNYEEAHHQVAAAELVNFWSAAESLVLAVGPGGCRQPAPQLRDDAPDNAPKPDCEGGAGCLFCNKNQDLRSFDHVWNLASLRDLKLAEFNADRTPLSRKQGNPVALTIERIAAKLDALRSLEGEYAEWVAEANLRVEEGRYHPFYTVAFDLLEAV